MVKEGKLDAIPSATSVNHPPRADFNKYDLNSHKVAIVDDISRGQGSEEGRVSPSIQGEFVEVTSKKSQKERQRKEKEEQKRQEEERRKDDNKKKRKPGPSRGGSAGPGSERSHHQTATNNKPSTAWSTRPTGSAPVGDGELWDTDETLQSHLPAVSAAPGSHLKHTSAPPTQAPPPSQSVQPAVSSVWPVDAPKPGVPHTAELVSSSTSDYSLFGGSSGLLRHAVDSTLPISTAMSASTAAPLGGQGTTGGVASGQKEPVATATDKKRDGWQPPPQVPTKVNEQEHPHSEVEESKGFQKVEKGSRGRGMAGSSKNLPPRLKSQQPEPGGPARGRGGRLAGRGSGGERRGPGDRREKGTQESAEKRATPSTTVTTEQATDKEKVSTTWSAWCSWPPLPTGRLIIKLK